MFGEFSVICRYWFLLLPILIILGTAYLSLGRRGCHSVSKMMNQTDIRIKILPALSDNYMYLVSSVIFIIIGLQIEC